MRKYDTYAILKKVRKDKNNHIWSESQRGPGGDVMYSSKKTRQGLDRVWTHFLGERGGGQGLTLPPPPLKCMYEQNS